MEPLPYLERVKIQSEILLPFYRRVCAELGDARAAALLRDAVQEFGTGLGTALAGRASGSSLQKLRSLVPAFTAGDALDIEPLVDSEAELTFNVRGCRYAEYFRSIGEMEFGAMITCEVDPPLTSGIGSDLELERTQTIMKHGSHCDFSWKMK